MQIISIPCRIISSPLALSTATTIFSTLSRNGTTLHKEFIIKSSHSLCSTGHPWKFSSLCCLQLSPWPRSTIFFCFLSHPLLPFATFSSAYLSFYEYIPDDSNLMQFSLLLLFLYVMFVLSNSIFFFFFWFSITFWWVILHNSSFVILSIHFIFIIRLKHLFTNIFILLVIWLVVFQLSQAYNNIEEKSHWTQNVFWFSLHLLSEIFLILRRIERDVVINAYCSSCKVPVSLCKIFTKYFIFATDLRNILKYEISWKSVKWERSCCLRCI